MVTPPIILAAVLGAIVWNLITWWLGLPTSSSHALIGGLAGAALVAAGPQAVIGGGLLRIAAVHRARAAHRPGRSASSIMLVVFWSARRATPPRGGRALPQAAAGLGGGLQPGPRRQRRAEDHGHHHRAAVLDRLPATGEFHVPLWVVLICHAAIALGTLFGGWRIVKTMGMSITKLQPVGGLLRRDRGRAHAVRGDAGGHPGLDHPHHHRARSSASGSARRSGSRPCAGAWPGASCGPGCSPCRWPPSSRPWPGSSRTRWG